MAPSGVSPVSHAVQIARRTRKRQSRRIGSTCKGRTTTACSRREACKLISIVGSEEVRAKEQDVKVVLPTCTSSSLSEAVNDSKNGSLIGGLAVEASDVSNVNAAAEVSEECDNNFCAVLCEVEREVMVDLQVQVASHTPVNKILELELAHVVPHVEDVPIPSFRSFSTKSVRFDLAATIIHEVIPYAEIYGAHPRTFVFDRNFCMIPAARGGFVSAGFNPYSEWEEDTSADFHVDESCVSQEIQEDGGWESWLLQQDDNEDDAEFDKTSDKSVSLGFTNATCLPDLDDALGWETWLEYTLGNTQEQIFCDDDTIVE